MEDKAKPTYFDFYTLLLAFVGGLFVMFLVMAWVIESHMLPRIEAYSRALVASSRVEGKIRSVCTGNNGNVYVVTDNRVYYGRCVKNGNITLGATVYISVRNSPQGPEIVIEDKEK